MRRYISLAALVVTIVLAARPASAQSVLPETVRVSAQQAAGTVLVVDALIDPSGTMTLQLEADELSFDRIRRDLWPAGFVKRAPRTTTQVGREIARAAFRAAPSTVRVRTVVILVRSTDPQEDPSRVRLSFSRGDLVRDGLLASI